MDSEIPSLIPLSQSPGTDASRPTERPSVPVLIVSGFLGSGKTTLLKHILHGKHGKRIAVLLNEFGNSMNIERSSLMQLSEGIQGPTVVQDWIELANGCLCCSVKDAGVKALENLLDQRGHFDYIIIETTGLLVCFGIFESVVEGLADPGPIAAMFWLEDTLQSRVHLDGVVTVVDALYALNYLGRGNSSSIVGENAYINGASECSRQIAAADRIILNKVDLVDDMKMLGELEETLSRINSVAPIQKTHRSKVPLDFILDLNAYRLDRVPDCLQRVQEGLGLIQHSSMSTVCLTLEHFSFIQWSKLEDWLQHILWEKTIPHSENGTNVHVIRMKGLLFQVDGNHEHAIVLQGVGEYYDKEQIPVEGVQHIQGSRIILIGEHLYWDQLQASLNIHFGL